MAEELGAKKTICVLATVVTCFAILWPTIFYPMFRASIAGGPGDENEFHRQERPPYVQQETVHPALREKGRAIPYSHVTSKPDVSKPPPSLAPIVTKISSSKPPLPSMRHTVHGPGQVAPPPKTNGPMGIIMPLYTIAIILFFGYTIVKVIFHRHDDEVENYVSDPEFSKTVFSDEKCLRYNGSAGDGPGKIRSNGRVSANSNGNAKLVVSAFSSLLQEVNRDILERDTGFAANAKADDLKNQLGDNKEGHGSNSAGSASNGSVEVVGMEMTESNSNGKMWNANASKNQPPSPPPAAVRRQTPPAEIFLKGSVPSNSQLFISDERTSTVPSEESSVILESKVTLSVISPKDEMTKNDEGEYKNNNEVDELSKKVGSIDLESSESLELEVEEGNDGGDETDVDEEEKEETDDDDVRGEK